MTSQKADSTVVNHREMMDVASEPIDSSARRQSEYETIGPPVGSLPTRFLPRGNHRNNRSTGSGTDRSHRGSSLSSTPSPTHRTSYRAFDGDNPLPLVSDINAPSYQSRMRQSTVTSQAEEIVIDGRYSLSMSLIGGGEEDGFVSIEALSSNTDMPTTKALDVCTKYVLNPYHVFLKIIGWRSFQSPRAHGTPLYKRCFNFAYPTFIFSMLTLTCLSQIGSCFSRTQSTSPPLISDSNGSNETYYVLNCKDNLVTEVVIGDVLILIAYLWALYVFRKSEKEHLSKLIQTVFLSCTSKLVHNSPRRLVHVLRIFLVVGVVWIFSSFVASLGRIFVLKYYRSHSYIGWFLRDPMNPSTLINPDKYKGVHYTLVVLSLIGFIFFDLLYIAVVINYICQCQLIHFFVRNTKEKVRTKDCTLEQAVKELFHINEYLTVLNGKLSYITSLVVFIFIQGVVFSYMSLLSVQPEQYLNIVVGILNVLQWSTGTLLVVIQATRLTAECNGLRKLGLEIGARPFVYSDTPQLLLDSFVLYTSSTNYKAKLSFVPMYPSLVCGFFFLLVLLITIYPQLTDFEFASWI